MHNELRSAFVRGATLLGGWLAGKAAIELLLRLDRRRERVGGVEASSWRNSVFTKDRTDLPFPMVPVSAEEIERVVAEFREKLR